MAEDAVKLCKRGHPRTPENLYMPGRSCKECHRITDRDAHARYRASGKGRLTDARYNASAKGWATSRRYKLKGARESIASKLLQLEREEEMWLQKSLERRTAKK